MISKKQKTLKGSMLVVLLLMIPSMLYAACTGSSPTWTTTPDYTSVNTCVANASAGDTINFTQGTATWTNTISIGKALTINGNGTTLIDGAGLIYGFFYINNFTDNANLMRITNFTFNSVKVADYRRAIYAAYVTLEKLRIDHNNFHYGIYQMELSGAIKGVVDNNKFYNGNGFLELSCNTREQANAAWADLSVGTNNSIFIEDNKFIIDENWPLSTTNGNGVDGNNGAKIVFRYNEFDYDKSPYTDSLATIGFHGNGGSYWERGSDVGNRSVAIMEIYNNTMHGPRIDTMFGFRGGVALIYNNHHLDTYGGKSGIRLTEEEYSPNYTSAFVITRTEWPGEDQIHNSFIWGNTIDGLPQSIENIAITNSPSENFIKKDRDFFLHAPCGGSDAVDAYGNTCTHGKASFTGVNGASGSYPTNGLTYPTKGTMKFTATGDNAYYGYTPYTYPHPLRNDTTSYTENPQSPTPTVPESPTTTVPPTIAVSPTTKDFGSLPINTSSTVQRFTVTTTGGNLNVDAISMTGTDATQFTILNDSCTGKIIAPTTGSCTFEAKFSPSSVGAKTANVSIVDNDSSTTGTIALSGIGVAAQVPNLSFSPTSFLYGVQSYTWSAPQTITLRNTGSAPVTISSLTLSGTNANQFSIPTATDYCTGETVAAYGNCSFQVIFYLASTGKKTADVNVTALYYDSPASLALFGYTVIDRNKPITISKKK